MPGKIMTITFAAFIAVACARIPGVQKGERAAVMVADSVIVEVLNENYYEARIHAVYAGGQRRSLGTIAGNGGRGRSAIAWEPRALMFEVLFVTDGATYLSQPIDVAPGQSVDVRLPQNIGASGFFRRVRRS